MAPRKIKKRAANAVEASLAPSSSAVAETSKSLKPEPKIMKKPSNQNSSKEITKTTSEAEASSLPSSSGKEKSKIVKPVTKIVKKSQNQNFARRRKQNNMSQAQDKSKDEKKNGLEANKELSSTERNDEKKDTKSSERSEKKDGNNEEKSEKRQRDHKDKEKLGGLILMCNSKTKPDCYRFKVMGVPLSKKEVVLAIKPGLKLFLFDFDLKLLYGIYSASSVGGMKLEPKAFDGAFPAQVRFKVLKDCIPLAEDVFKKAIRFRGKHSDNKFQTQLSVEQVKKLTDLFKPLQQQSIPRSYGRPVSPIRTDHSARMPTVSHRENYENRRESHLDRERFTRDHYSPREERMHHRPADRERERFSRHHSSPPRESTYSRLQKRSDDALFLSEKDYRTYGLSRAEHARRSPVRVPTSDVYRDDRHGVQLHNPPSSHIPRDAFPLHREEVPTDPLLFSERAYHTYGLRAPAPSIPPVPDPRSLPLDVYPRDSNYTYGHNVASSDPYALPLRREAVPSDPYALPPRREAVQSDPYALPPRRESVQSDPYALPPRREAVPSGPYAQPPRREAVPSDPYAQPPRREAVPSDPYAQPPRREAVPSDPYIPLPLRREAVPSDPYIPLPLRRESVPSDPYIPLPLRREAVPSDPYIPLPRRETHVPDYDYNAPPQRRFPGDEERLERSYPPYAPHMLPDYNQRQHLVHGADHAAGTVSSRYSFPGPSASYR